MLALNSRPESQRVIVALDCDGSQARTLAEELKGGPSWLKVGMTLFYEEGPAIVTFLKDLGFKVFLDLKLHDIPHQVKGAAHAATLAGADMLTVHAAGGLDMMKAAREGIEEACALLPQEQTAHSQGPITLAVTVLTSMDGRALCSVGVRDDIDVQIKRLALLAQEAGLSGVVASPLEAHMLRELLGNDACICTPGIRPSGADLADQSRVMTPQQAFIEGASCIVIGRPITQAKSPRQAYDDIAKGLRS